MELRTVGIRDVDPGGLVRLSVAETHRALATTDTDQTFEYHFGASRALYCNGP